jgi:hypothetical protein
MKTTTSKTKTTTKQNWSNTDLTLSVFSYAVQESTAPIHRINDLHG